MPEIILASESYAIMGACFEVYKQLGPGFLEAVYFESLELEFQARHIPYIARPPLKLYYAGVQLRQGYAPDFLCYGQIILEIKAATGLIDEHQAQLINYLKATKMELGILLNFGGYPKLMYERIVMGSGKYQFWPLECEA